VVRVINTSDGEYIYGVIINIIIEEMHTEFSMFDLTVSYDVEWGSNSERHEESSLKKIGHDKDYYQKTKEMFNSIKES